MSAGTTGAGEAPPEVGRRRPGFPRPRDRHVDPTIRRKLTDRERRWLDDLFDHLERIDRRMQRCAWRHYEPI